MGLTPARHYARAALALARSRLGAALSLALVLSTLLYGCARCGDGASEGAAIATLSKVAGDGVTRDFAAHVHEWQKAAPGAQLALGDGAQTDGQSTAELTFVNGSGLALKPNTIVRLLTDQGQGTGLDVQAGEAILRVGASGLSLRTHVGLATIDADSEIVLRRRGEALGFEVALGRLNFRDRENGEVDLEAGDSVDVGIGMAVLALSRGQKVPDKQISVEVINGEARAGAGAGRPLGKGVHAVAPNTRLRLPEGTEVIVRRGQEQVQLRGSGDFTVGVQKALAESKRGGMVLEAMEVDVEVHVPGGVIIARGGAGGSSANVNVGATDGQVRVQRGKANAQIEGREPTDIAEGESFDWTLPGAVAEGDVPAGTTRGPDYRNMSSRVGESFVVHTPSAPIAIGFDFSGRCPAEGQLELVGGRQLARGKGSANLLFPVGLRNYSLRCIGANGTPGKVVGRGSVQVLIDTGTRKLPARAPVSNVEADGRTYSIYYQNQLPEVIARWPNAPAQKSYQLQLDGKTMDLSQPEHRFKSGTLSDGSHALVFQAQGRRSRTTTVEVHFDNVAPKASLSAPEDRGYAPGDTVTVEGVALPTWKVALEGGTIEMSSGDRFSGHVQTSAERPDIAVRLSHPRLGTHYYLRRASGSP